MANEYQQALALHLDCDIDDVKVPRNPHLGYSAHGKEYLIFTEAEANEAARDRILDSAWAFNADFIAGHTSPRFNWGAQQTLREVQGKLCEDANDLVLALLKNVNAFVADAIRADGRGHFLAGYDHEEHEVCIDGETFFIYRQ